MGHLTPYDTYMMFMAMKFHFTQKKYNYLQYHGKVKSSPEQYEQKRDRFLYVKLSKRYSAKKMEDFLVANFIRGKLWIGDFLEDDAEDNYLKYVKRKQSLTYTFENELEFLLKCSSPSDLFKVKSGQYPSILQDYMSGSISLETLSILNVFFCFDKVFDEKIGKDDILWSKIRLLMTKLHPFLSYDKEKIRSILKSRILNT